MNASSSGAFANPSDDPLHELIVPLSLPEDEVVARLRSAAQTVRQRAHAPYSRFLVGSALRCARTGRVFTGCNVENASFPAGVCAERTAICAAIASGCREFDHCVVTTAASTPTAPCGSCRQMLGEFGMSIKVSCFTDASDASLHATLSDLLPSSFSQTDLGTGVTSKE